MDIRRKEDEQNNEASQQDNSSASKSKAGKKSVFGTILIVIIVAALVAVGFYFTRGEGAINGDSVSDPVAIVNGQEISNEQLSTQLESIQNAQTEQAQQFNSLSETQQQEILLEGIINAELQLQAAKSAGVTVSDEEVEARLQESIDQIGEEEFENRLEQNDVTAEEVREDLRDQMIINAYIQQGVDGGITATDEEVQALYQQYSSQIGQAAPEGQNGEVPSLEELRPQIEAAVIQQKQQQIALQLLEQARANADIEILIEGVNYPAQVNEQQTPPANTQPVPTQQSDTQVEDQIPTDESDAEETTEDTSAQ